MKRSWIPLLVLMLACASTPSITNDVLETRIGEELEALRSAMPLTSALPSVSAYSSQAPTTGQAYYERNGITLKYVRERERHPEAYRHGALEMARSALNQAETPVLIYRESGVETHFEPAWPEQELEGVGIDALIGIAYVADVQFRGAEFDALVPARSGTAGYLSLWHEPSGQLIVEYRSAREDAVDGMALNAAQLRNEFGVGPIEGWSTHELRGLRVVLSKLTPEERRAISHVSFRRLAKPTGAALATGCTAGCYRMEAADAWIEVYDGAFKSDGHVFIGELDAPYAPSVHVILHEIGHAIAKRELARANRALTRCQQTCGTLVNQFNAKGRRVRPDEVESFQRMSKQLAEIQQLSKGLSVFAQSYVKSSPLNADFATVAGAGRGPTSYGWKSLDESFAEYFSLCRLDPSACQRIAPEVAVYFDSGRHLR